MPSFFPLQNLQEEHARQAFDTFDKNNLGVIHALEFRKIMTTIKGHLLTGYCADNLVSVRIQKHTNKCGIWESHSHEICLLEGNLCNLEGKFIIMMDLSDDRQARRETSGSTVKNVIPFRYLFVYISLKNV